MSHYGNYPNPQLCRKYGRHFQKLKTMSNTSLYLTQLKLHKQSLEITLSACNEEIKHLNVSMELAEMNKKNIQDSIAIANEQIAHEENANHL